MQDFVYFPDLCLLQLIRVSNPGLYNWIEHYLTERAVVETGQGALAVGEKEAFQSELTTHMKGFRPSMATSISALAEWIPGISGDDDISLDLFCRSSEDFRHIQTTGKRLSSLTHWRYYFAFSSPQNVLPPEYFIELFGLAGRQNSQLALSEQLLSSINSIGSVNATWFEHILSRLTPRLIEERSFDECAGMVQFFFDHTDTIEARFKAHNIWFSLRETEINQVVRHLVRHSLTLNESGTVAMLEKLVSEGGSPFWIADFMRDLLREHGLTQNEDPLRSDMLLSQLVADRLRHRFAERINQQEMRERLLKRRSLLGYLYAWKDICSLETVREWVREVSASDQGLMDLLMRLRTSVFSSKKGAYRKISNEQVSPFFDDWQSVEHNVRSKLSESRLTAVQEELKRAMEYDD